MPRCRGSGRYHHASEHGTVCLKCKGKGKLSFSTSPEARAAARIKSAAKKQAVAQKQQEEALEKLKAFEALHPDIAGWWADTDFEFALSLRGAVMRTGKLTDNQLAAARKCVSKLEEAKAERLKREAEAAQAPVLDLTAISGAMGKARDLGIKRPKMRLLAGDQGFVLSFAPDTGKWGGSLYAKLQDGTYLGRITAGGSIRLAKPALSWLLRSSALASSPLSRQSLMVAAPAPAPAADVSLPITGRLMLVSAPSASPNSSDISQGLMGKAW